MENHIHIQTKNSFLSTQNFEDIRDIITSCIDEIKNQLIEYPLIMVYGKQCRQRRSIGFFSDTSIGYFYSGQLCESKPLTNNLILLLEEVNNRVHADFNGILVNKYISGDDYISKHSDDETGLDNVGVVSISYGAVRKFRIREKNSGKKVVDIPTLPYYLIHMGGDFQKEFTHEIPVEKKVKDTRYSFTFRKHTT
jgi:alkylated DNA repair dioxygenase AlkB